MTGPFDALLRENAAALGIALSETQAGALLGYAELVAKWNRTMNLVSSGALDVLIRNHLTDCLSAIPYVDGAHIVDVGSGAGLLGIVIAIMRPESQVTLVESNQKKARFLRQVAIELPLGNVSVVASRIENWRPGSLPDCIVCRAYSSLEKFLADTHHLHQPGGSLVAMKGAEESIEGAGLDGFDGTIRFQQLSVPGWDHRHLVIFQCKG
ncbi:MAG: 16S rRNA (guanine(527)-N(7))-methyltransferase RsmG [Proteobacteria bacterium]|nr:16S rRNA (guanine(527)-N(7))-methyltransferase RsmG [Pseudomonadota bacterium]